MIRCGHDRWDGGGTSKTLAHWRTRGVFTFGDGRVSLLNSMARRPVYSSTKMWAGWLQRNPEVSGEVKQTILHAPNATWVPGGEGVQNVELSPPLTVPGAWTCVKFSR